MMRRPFTIPTALYFFSFLTIMFAIVQAVQIPLGALPEESARIATMPYSHFAHAVGGALFGILGPIQFGRVLARRYGRLHRVMGRVFVVAGAALSISSLSMLWQFPDSATPLVSGTRLVFGILLGFALVKAMLAVRNRQFNLHRDWMIRAYAIGVGATAVSMVFIPIFAITGEPPTGLVSDLAFVGSWVVCVAIAELVVRKLNAANMEGRIA